MIKLLKKAAHLAGTNKDIKNFYMACVAVRKDGAIVTGINHCVSGQRIPEHHAEARALRKAGVGAVLYVARVLKVDKKTWANSKPCAYCRYKIRSQGVIRVYYTIGPNEWGVWNVC